MIDRKRVILYIMSCVQQEHKTIRNARVAQLVERDLAKVEAAGSSPVSRFFHAKDIRKDILFLHEKSTKRDKCCMQYFFGYYFMNRIFFAILLRIREK